MKKEQDLSLLSSLGERVRQFRNNNRLTQEELADRCGFDRTYISLLERGKRNISFSNLKALSAGLDVTISELTKDI